MITPTMAEARTQLHQGLPPQLRSPSVWPMKPIRPPATGPYRMANSASTAYCRQMLVFGMPLGMAHEPGQHEEQGGADADRDDGLNGHLFHGEILLFRMSAL